MAQGSLVAIEARDGKIILEAKRLEGDRFSAEDWTAMDKLVRRQVKTGAFTEYSSPLEARKHLRFPRK